jgi:hypothetical protein
VQLTALTLSAWSSELGCAAVLARCTALTQLQHAEIGLGSLNRPKSFNWQHLPASLTQLTVHAAHLDSSNQLRDVKSSSSGQLSALLKLELSDIVVGPSHLFVQMLSMCPQLQVLVCNMHSQFGSVRVTSADMLAGVRQLQHLRSLSLSCIQGYRTAAADYAALTASSHLTSLSLHDCDIAAGAAQYTFRPGVVLLQLQQVSIQELELCGEELWSDGFGFAVEACLQLGPGAAANLARCCPLLRKLELAFIQEGLEARELQPLLQLSALTHLGIGGEGCDGAVVKEVLAQLTGGAAGYTSQSGIVSVTCIVDAVCAPVLVCLCVVQPSWVQGFVVSAHLKFGLLPPYCHGQ